jgi:hypothetical protein
LIATRARIEEESEAVSDWSERNDDDAAFTPDVSPDVLAVNTADTFPIDATLASFPGPALELLRDLVLGHFPVRVIVRKKQIHEVGPRLRTEGSDREHGRPCLPEPVLSERLDAIVGDPSVKLIES